MRGTLLRLAAEYFVSALMPIQRLESRSRKYTAAFIKELSRIFSLMTASTFSFSGLYSSYSFVSEQKKSGLINSKSVFCRLRIFKNRDLLIIFRDFYITIHSIPCLYSCGFVAGLPK